MKIIGLTGSFGTGKTFVASIFRTLGARVIDADMITHGLLKKGTGVYRDIVKAFGKPILSRGGDIDRHRLAAVVFADKKKRALLERIVHPRVISSIIARTCKAKFGDVVVIDAPLLIEADLGRIVDELVVVKASRKRQIERAMKKSGMGRRDAQRRIDSQIPLNRKIEMADFVIDNDGTMSETRKITRKVWREIVWK